MQKTDIGEKICFSISKIAFDDNTEVFGSTGFGNNGLSGIRNILAMPKLKFCIKKSPKQRNSGSNGQNSHPQLIFYFRKPLFLDGIIAFSKMVIWTLKASQKAGKKMSRNEKLDHVVFTHISWNTLYLTWGPGMFLYWPLELGLTILTLFGVLRSFFSVNSMTWASWVWCNVAAIEGINGVFMALRLLLSGFSWFFIFFTASCCHKKILFAVFHDSKRFLSCLSEKRLI